MVKLTIDKVSKNMVQGILEACQTTSIYPHVKGHKRKFIFPPASCSAECYRKKYSVLTGYWFFPVRYLDKAESKRKGKKFLKHNPKPANIIPDIVKHNPERAMRRKNFKYLKYENIILTTKLMKKGEKKFSSSNQYISIINTPSSVKKLVYLFDKYGFYTDFTETFFYVDAHRSSYEVLNRIINFDCLFNKNLLLQLFLFTKLDESDLFELMSGQASFKKIEILTAGILNPNKTMNLDTISTYCALSDLLASVS